MTRCPQCGAEPLTLIIPQEYGPAGWGLECDTCGFTHAFPVRVRFPEPPGITMDQIRHITRLCAMLHQPVPPMEKLTHAEAQQHIDSLREEMRQAIISRHPKIVGDQS